MSGVTGRFDASAEEPAETTATDDLRAIVDEQADGDLDVALDRLDESVSAWEETDDGLLDESTQALLDAVSGADDAPLAWRSLHDRVERGTLTWQAFWLDPAAEADGPMLVGQVLRRQTEASIAALAQVRGEIAEARREGDLPDKPGA